MLTLSNTELRARSRGLNGHVHAVLGGEAVEDRIRLVYGSNRLTPDQMRYQARFLRAFCLYGALEPYMGTRLDLGIAENYASKAHIEIDFNCRREDVEDGNLPGARVDHMGDLVIQGLFYRNGKPWPISMPLMLRLDDDMVRGVGPWANFLPRAKMILADAFEGACHLPFGKVA